MKTMFPDIAAYPSLLEILEDAARRRPGEVAMALAADEGMLHAWSAPEVLRRSRLAAWRLYALGMRPGDRLLTWCPSGPALAALPLGAVRPRVALGPPGRPRRARRPAAGRRHADRPCAGRRGRHGRGAALPRRLGGAGRHGPAPDAGYALRDRLHLGDDRRPQRRDAS